MRRVGGGDESHADSALAGLHGDFDFGFVVKGVERDVFTRADLEQLQALAVEGDFELLVFAVAAEQGAHGGADYLEGNGILAVGREIMMDQHSAAGSEGQAFDVIFLRVVLANVIHLAGGSGVVAEREAADLRGGGDVGLHQRRRDLQAAGHVVESVAGVVGGQVGGDVDVEP